MPVDISLIEIGRRIEFVRGNLSQADFAARLGVDRKTVGTWERGERLLDTKALLALWGEFDAVPAWVLLGDGEGPSLSGDEQELLALYRSASLTGKAAAIGALQGMVAGGASPNQARKFVVKGRGQRVAGRDYHENGKKKDDDGSKGQR